MASKTRILCKQKTAKAAQAYILKRINEWAKKEGIGVEASEIDTECGKAIQVEEFGFESAVRFTMGEGIYGDDYDCCCGPAFDYNSPFVYCEALNNYSFKVYEV